jgi:hypothetical protein
VTADSSITDAVNYARSLSVACGQGLVTENFSTDLDAMKTLNLYFRNIAIATGGKGSDNTGVVDQLTCLQSIARNLGQIVKTVS